MKQKLLIINKDPFGYHVDTYKYCKYLRDRYDITYICIEPKKEKIDSLENLRVIYITNKLPRILRGVYYTLYCILFTIFFKGIIFVKYFETAGLIKKVLFWKKMILDIRTLSISTDTKIREKYDKKLIKTTRLFEHVSIISEGIRDKMKIEKSKTSILPLGADQISNLNKDFSKLKLLYVGTLSGRRIEDTIEGFNIFHRKFPLMDITFDIVGSGFNNEFEKLQNLIQKLDLTSNIKMHGFIPNNDLLPFFDSCNIGISYIPLTDYYNFQPPTKTYEYILSGLFTIATSTYCNQELINDTNGLLIHDNPESFAKALDFIHKSKEINSTNIRETLTEYTWEKIVNNTLIPILNTI